MNKIEILRFLIYSCVSCVAGLFIYAWQIVGIKEINRKKLILPVTLVVLATIFTILKNIEEKKAEQIAAEKADQMYYEEMFYITQKVVNGKKIEYSAVDGNDSLYEIECENNKNCKIDDSDFGNVFIEGSYVEKLELMANYLYFKSAGKTIYEELAEDNITEDDDIEFLANENYSDVMRLKRLHRQTLDFYRNVEQNKIYNRLCGFIKYN